MPNRGHLQPSIEDISTESRLYYCTEQAFIVRITAPRTRPEERPIAADDLPNSTTTIERPPRHNSPRAVSPRNIHIREPRAEDGARVHRLIARCAPLDPNSLYCNLLQCSHFADTCAIAFGDHDDEPLGFVSGHIPPRTPDTLFVWQVAVSPSARGQRLGQRLMRAILERERALPLRYLNATVTPDNTASQRMFAALANELRAPIRSVEHFDRNTHFEGVHASEHLHIIGPLERRQAND